ncbi:MAG: glycoside hydrolase family 88 protein [Prolixibacteraceae bacterium]|nr:glycoside hydrolase family 88 protein [Prolixibacteraceae bacterium]
MKKLIVSTISVIIFAACSPKTDNDGKQVQFDGNVDYSVLMAKTIIEKYPDLWSIEDREEPKLTYTYGLIGLAMLEVYGETENEEFLNYAEYYANSLIEADGKIKTYEQSDYNIDKLNSGRFLFDLYEITGDEKYRMAIETLRDQLDNHPRTEIGGFWHKKRYPHQMWLDGVYMGGPFYTRYAVENNEPESLDEVALWITNVEKVTRDEETGLLYHGWDESREQQWADKETGCSPHFWGRGMGWYSMALVDVLDYFPEEHEGYQSIVDIVNRVADVIVKYQHDEKGIWYQVIDQADREGNYLEGSVSTMFSYFLLKAINKGYIPEEEYRDDAIEAYQGVVNHLLEIDNDSLLTITPVCAVAGLGGDPYRDGSYEYYINEKKRDNDPKAVGPFILAGIEYQKLDK